MYEEKHWQSLSETYCFHPNHSPPSMLYIPPGQVYEHKCPGCGYVVKIKGENTNY